MIHLTLNRNAAGFIYEFCVEEHSKSKVCAAVSLLCLNTVNSIESLTASQFECDYDPKGGFLHFKLPNMQSVCKETDVLLEAMVLGLKSVKESYPDDIDITNISEGNVFI